MASNVLESIDAIIEGRSLLKHPFYQAWTAGTLPIEAMREFPTFLSAIHSRCQAGPVRQALLTNLWDEEAGDDNHLALWLRFCEGLGLGEDEVRSSVINPETRDLVEGFKAACSSGPIGRGLATLYAYEAQAPEVARQKIAGLKRNYGIEDARSLSFFQVHQDLDVEHSRTEREILAASSETDAAEMEEAVRTAAGRLWRFLDGAYAACAAR
jgi:pyrroloquinoline-quinone synthase